MKKIIPTLTNSRIILRSLTLDDASDIFAYAQNEEVSKYVFWDAHKTINDSITFITDTINQKENNLMWAIQLKENNKVIGTCGFIEDNSINKSLKIGYTLNQEYWHKGYNKEALQTIIAYAFENLDAIRIEGICVEENIASANSMISCGMKFEGILHDAFIKNETIHNCKLFAITKRNYLKNIKKNYQQSDQ